MKRMLRALIATLVTGIVGAAAPATAGTVAATLEGCVLVSDLRLPDARWFSPGTFQAVAFDDPKSGCAPTITLPVLGAYEFDENRVENTLAAWLDLDDLPTCGRRQYDVQLYLEDGVLDPMGLRSLVIDTGVDCEDDGTGALTVLEKPPAPANVPHVPEPATLVLVTTAAAACVRRQIRRTRIP
jgi:hypothetical protein